MLVLTDNPIYVSSQVQTEELSSLDGTSTSDEIKHFQKWFNNLTFADASQKPKPLKEIGKWDKDTQSAYNLAGKRYEDVFVNVVDNLATKPIDSFNIPRIDPLFIKNPFPTRKALITFQKWAMEKDPTMFKKYGADGKWGNEGSDAWKNYGTAYLELFTIDGEPIKSTPAYIKFPFSYSLSSVGFAVGIAYAIKNKTGFWKGFGYSIIFSIAGGSLGAGIDYLRKPKV